MPRHLLVLTSFLFVLTGCGPDGDGQTPVAAEPAASVAVAESADSAFDRALDDMTRAFFYHNPEQATIYGVSELVVPRTAYRIKSRSPLGETARREELNAALERMLALDTSELTGNRARTHAVVTTLMGGALAPAAVADFGTTVDGFGFYFLPRRHPGAPSSADGRSRSRRSATAKKPRPTSCGSRPCRRRWTARWRASA